MARDLRDGEGFEMTVNASQPEQDELLQQCVQDLWAAKEDGRLRLETPRGSVGQTALHNLNIYYNAPTRLDPYDHIGLDFEMRCEDDELSRVASDQHDYDLTMAAYGDRHVWELSDMWGQDIDVNIYIDCKDTVQTVSVRFLEAVEIGWRWP